MGTIVTAIPPASPEVALAHFRTLLSLETDCWDVHASLTAMRSDPDFVLLDVRSAASFAAGHIEGAESLPHAEITAERLDGLLGGRLAVVYCAGPHCNGADRAAARIAELGHPVKKMIGGVTGWRDEGFVLVR
jgi:rhodanese-related sulfurtransferase